MNTFVHSSGLSVRSVSFTISVVGLIGRLGLGGRGVVSGRVNEDNASVNTGVERTRCTRNGTSFASGLRVTLGRTGRANC